MRCPRRDEVGQNTVGEDTWGGDETCSYCGSLSPEQFLKLASQGAELTPTDKNYKVYVARPGFGKFYFQHLSAEQRTQFVGLLNERKLKIGVPGRFYVLPFFVSGPEKKH